MNHSLVAAQSTLLSWVFASTAFYVLGCNAGWLWLRVRGLPLPRQSAAWVQALALGEWLAVTLWLLLPAYVLLLQGRLSPRMMGLSQIDLGWTLGVGLIFAAAALSVLLAAGITLRRGIPGSPPYRSFSHAAALSILLVVQAGALQWQWAFYRSAAIGWAGAQGMARPEYAGAWLAAGWLVVQGALNPWLWHDLRTPGQAEVRIVRAVLLAATTVLYLLSRNFWLAWLLHAAVIAVLEPRLRQPTAEQTANKKGYRQSDAAGSLANPLDQS